MVTRARQRELVWRCPMLLLFLPLLWATQIRATESTSEDEEESEPGYAVLLPWFAQAVGIVVFYFTTRTFWISWLTKPCSSWTHHLKLPYTAILFVAGMFMGIGTVQSGFDDQLTHSIKQWTNINHEVLFLVFLPGLLFKDAFEINFHLFQASLSQLLVLAFPMVLAGTMLTALVGYYIFPYGWSLNLSFTFGSILAATDPVAVSALLNELGAPPRLKMHISGESLLNDGSAVVFFTVFSGLFLNELDIGLGEDSSVGHAFATFFRMSLGGAAVGLAFAIALITILFRLDRKFETEETVLQVAATITIAYLSFYTAEMVCEMSGVISVVTCGIVTRAFGGGLISDPQVMASFWSLVEHLLNTLLFALGGIEFGSIVANPDRDWSGRDWGYLIMLYLFVQIIRFALLAAFYPIISRIGLKTNWRETAFSGWAGLRGAVGIALALGLDNEVRAATDDPDKLELTTNVFGMVGGVAFLTLSINGTLSEYFLTKLGLAESTESRKRIVKAAENAARRRMLDDFLHLMTDPRFYFVDFSLVTHHCPILKGLTIEELQEAVDDNRKSVHPDEYLAPNLNHVFFPYVPNSENLKRKMEIEARKSFMQNDTALPKRVGSNFQSALISLPGTDEDAAHVGTQSEIMSNEALVKDIRIMFIELLRAAYQAQIRDGELDPREYNGFLVYTLTQSLEFAHDAAQRDQPLDDFNLSSYLVSADLMDRGHDFTQKLYGSCCVRGRGTTKQRIEAFGDSAGLEYQRLRLDVLKAFAFIDAHTEAQDRLRDEFENVSGSTTSAFIVIMEESRGQVKKAKEVLRSKTQKDFRQVISHHLCIILQNKLARYIKLLLDSGVLLQREARHYLEESDQAIEQIRRCTAKEHEGIIHAEGDEDLEEGDNAKGTKSTTQGGRHRRRRVKQDSIL